MPFVDEEHLLGLHKKLDLYTKEKQSLEHSIRIFREQHARSKRTINTLVLLISTLIMILVVLMIYPGFWPGREKASVQQGDPEQVLIARSYLDSLEHRVREMEAIQRVAQTVDSVTREDQMVYAVQIGAFEKSGMGMFSESFLNIQEDKTSPYKRYALGQFLSLEEARAFRKVLIGIGFEDAFIASYKNGKRIKIEDSL